jgi:hypothetical protein
MKSSYQRLKDRIAKLEEENSALYADIRMIVKFPHNPASSMLKARYNLKYQLEAMAWAGKVPMVTSEGSTTVKVSGSLGKSGGGIGPMMKAALEAGGRPRIAPATSRLPEWWTDAMNDIEDINDNKNEEDEE